jgi:hypothetical protein
MSSRKSRMMIYVEFFKSQNPRHIEMKLRELAKERTFPPFRKLTVMIDHTNMKTTDAITKHPLVLQDDEIR